MEKPIVFSLGGSLIVPKAGIDVGFLSAFRRLIASHVRRGRRFVIICGGGQTAREYQEAAREAVRPTRDEIDWVGIHTTRLNAHLLRTIFGGMADPQIVTDPHEFVAGMKPVVFAGGGEPGCSTDRDAVLLAERTGAKTVINLSNIDYVYDCDPAAFPDAKPIPHFTWKEFRHRFGGPWRPGMHAPFDPVASKAAESLGIRVVIASGGNMKNVSRIISGKSFVGTVVEG